MPPQANACEPSTTQKRPREADTTSSTLSDYDSRELDDITAAREDPHHEIGTPPIKRRREREDDALWSYALDEAPKGLPARGKSKQELFYCKRCSDRGVAKSLSSATAFRRHLKNSHGILTQPKRSEVDINTEATLAVLFNKQAEAAATGRDPKTSRILQEAVNEKAFVDALIYLIVTRNLPHTIVEWPEFRAFLQICNYTLTDEGGPLYKSRRSVPLLIGKTFVIHKDRIKLRLKKAKSKIHFTTDCWTAPNKTAYQAVTAHFVDELNQLSKATIALREHKEVHGGEQQAEVMIKVIEEYEIPESQIGYLTSDNHGSNDKLCRILQKRFPTWNATQHRIRCIGHIINLAVQAFLFHKDTEAVEIAIRAAEELQREEQQLHLESEHEYSQDEVTQTKWREIGALGKIHNIAVWLRRSTERYQAFLKLAKKMLRRDNDTRWNSWLLMLESAIELETTIRVFLDLHHKEISANALSRDEWDTIRETIAILLPFKDATKALEGDSTTLDEVLQSMDFLIEHVKEMQQEHASNAHLSASLLTIWFAFDKYYTLTDKTPVYAAALLLNPTLRKAYLDESWKTIDERHPGTIERSIEAARKLWQKEYKFKPVNGEAAEQLDPDLVKNSYMRWKYMRELKSASADDEFERFITADPLQSIAGSSLTWWLEPSQQKLYPRLSRMAIDILSIPAMSAEAERVFSGARRTISWTRCRLGATVVEQTECLKSWIREVIKSGGFASEEVAAEVINIEGESLGNPQDDDIGNNQVVDEEYKEA